jgi:hypothetical protein
MLTAAYQYVYTAAYPEGSECSVLSPAGSGSGLWDSSPGVPVTRGGSVRTVTAVGEFAEVSIKVEGCRPGRDAWMSRGVGSSSAVVVVDDPSEGVTPTDLTGGSSGVARRRDSELKSTVRSSLVVVLDVVGEHGCEVTSGVHEQVVQAFFAHGLHLSLREGVRFW